MFHRCVTGLTYFLLACVLAATCAEANGLLRLAPAALQQLKAQEPNRVQQALSWVRSQRSSMGLGEADSFISRSSHTDEFGQTHVRVRQTHRGIPIWGSEAVIHLDASGRALPMTGAAITGVNVDPTPGVDEATVIRLIKRNLGTQGPLVVPKIELVIVANPGGPQATLKRDPHTGAWSLDADHSVLHRPSSRDPYLLVYFVHTELDNPVDGLKHTDFLVEAATGLILRKWNSLMTDGPAKGTAHTQYNGDVTLDTADVSSTLGGFQLLDLTRPTLPHPVTLVFGNITDNLHNGPTVIATGTNNGFLEGTPYLSSDNHWGDGQNFAFDPANDLSDTTNGQTTAADAHFGMAATWDFYRQVLGRNGIDDLGSSVHSRVHAHAYFYNAYWDPYFFVMTYGDGGQYLKSFTPLDIVGHELSHGVMATTADLIYGGEMGGLNEANSDILGMMVKFYTRGGTGNGVVPDTGGDWQLGAQLATPLAPGPLRWMDTPSRDGVSYDAWFQGMAFDDVHYLSGPGNRMFYYLSHGAPSADPNQSLYLPEGFAGIGNDKAIRIWYRALTTYLTSFSDYHDTRVQTLKACADLYGASSPEYAAVENAFAAINVGHAHGQPDRPEIQIDAVSPYFDGYFSGVYPNLIRFVPAGQTTPDPVFPVQVLNTSNQAVTWSLDAGGQIGSDGRYTASKRIYGFYPVEVKSQSDALEHARGMVANVDIDVNDDTELDATDLGSIALAYGSNFWAPTPPTRFDQKADLDGGGSVDDLDVEIYMETFRAYIGQ